MEGTGITRCLRGLKDKARPSEGRHFGSSPSGDAREQLAVSERDDLINEAFEDFLRAFPECYGETAEIIRQSHPADIGGIIREAFRIAAEKLIDKLESYPR